MSECKEAEDKSGKAARRTVLILVDAIYRIQAQSAIVATAPITLQLLLGSPGKEWEQAGHTGEGRRCLSNIHWMWNCQNYLVDSVSEEQREES